MLGSRSVTRRRVSAGTYDATGIYTPGSSTDTTISGAWQPAPGTTFGQTEDGQRAANTTELFTQSALRSVDQYGQVGADRIVVDTVVYVVQQVSDFSPTGMSLSHRQATCTRLQEGGV